MIVMAGVFIAMGIPGQSAPASLKRSTDRGILLRRGWHSGAVCPGLIEAAQESIYGPRNIGAFRGSLPRPH